MADTALLTQLRQLLTTLGFDLGVDYENLSGQGKADKARELVDHMKRYERLADLVRMGRQARPDVPWPELGTAPAVEPSPVAPSPTESPTLRALKRKTLERRLADLSAEYEAANGQLDATLAAVDRLRIQRQIKALEGEIGQVDAELKALG